MERALAWPLLAALVFTIPWEKSLMVPDVGTVTRLVGVLAFAAGLLTVAGRRSFRRPNLAFVAAACFVSWSAMTLLWSYSRPGTQARAATLVQLLVLLWLIWELCRTPGQQRGLMTAYVAGATVASVLTYVRYLRGLQTYYRRYAAAGFDPNDLGLTVAVAIPLALYLSLKGRGPVRWLYRAAAAVAIGAVLLAASRTALIVTFLAFGFALWTWREAGLSQKLSSVALLGLLVLGLVCLAPAASRQRLATLPSEVAKGTLHNRTQIWKAGVRVFRHRPLRGVGAGAFAEAVRPRLGTPAIAGHQYVAHNTYLSVLVECGLIGFGLFALAGALLAGFIWIMPFAERALWSVMLAVCAVGVATLTWEHRKPVWLFAGLIMTEWARSFLPRGDRR
jgi:O-antigen ligase